MKFVFASRNAQLITVHLGTAGINVAATVSVGWLANLHY